MARPIATLALSIGAAALVLPSWSAAAGERAPASLGAQPAPCPVHPEDWRPGDPVPSGYHAENRMIRGLIIPGAVVFASFYFTGVLAAGLGDAKLDALYVPVAGPFILLGKGSGDSDFKKVMVLDGANQVIGLGLVVAAFLVKRTLLIKDRRVMTRVYPVPKFGADGVGVSLVGQF